MAVYLRLLLALPLLLLAGVVAAADTDRFDDALPPHAVARIGTNRLRHGGAVTAIAFTADSKKFATTSADRTVSVWETETGRELLRCHGFDHQPRAVAFTGDGKALLCVADGSARVYEFVEGKDQTRPAEAKELRQFSLKADKIVAAAFSGDAHWLAVGDEDGKVRLWDMKEGKVLTEFSPEGGVRCLAVSSEANRIATTTGINGLQTWDATNGSKQNSFGKGAYSVLAFSPDGSELTAGNFDNQVQVYETAKGKALSTFVSGKEIWPQSKNGMACLAYTANGKFLATGAGDGTVRVWGRVRGETAKAAIIEDHTERVTAVALSPDGKWLVSGAADNTLRRYDTSNWKEFPLSPRPAPQAPLIGLTLSPDGRCVVTLDALGRLAAWDARTGKPSEAFHDTPTRAGGVAFSPDGKTLTIAESGRHFGFWDVSTGRRRDVWNLKDIDDDKAAVYATAGMVYDGGGKRLAVGSAQGLYLSVHDGSGKRVALFTASGGRRAGCLSLSPDGTTLASAGTEALVRLWDIDHDQEKATLLGHSGGTLAVAFSPNGHSIASGGKDRMIRLWEVASGQQRQVLGGQPGWVRAVAFAPDGTVLATANTDGSVRLWELTTGRLLHELSGHRGAVTRLAFSAKGEVLASASVDTTVLVWDTAQLLKDRKAAVITLTPKELERSWEQLASSDVGTASAALQTLARAPAQTVLLLRQHVQPLKAERLTQLLKDLDDDAFPVREAAAQELAATGKFAEPSLQKALKGMPSPEVRRSVEELLEKLRAHGPTPEELRLIRSLEVLELIGDDEAKKLLRHVAEEGATESELTRQAKAALERLGRRVP